MPARPLEAFAAIAAMGITAVLTCGPASGSGGAAVDPSEVKDKLMAADLTCGEDSIGMRAMEDGSNPFATVECYNTTGWYQVDVWDSADGLRTWWAARCANQSSDSGLRAVGSFWTTDIQTREEAQFIADALGGAVKTNAEWCANPANIGADT